MRTYGKARFQKAEQELSAVYKDLMQQLDDVWRKKFRMAQSAWVQFREANAGLVADVARGGSEEALRYVSLRLEHGHLFKESSHILQPSLVPLGRSPCATATQSEASVA